MNEMTILLLPLLFGIILGVFFFGGLWWTTQLVLSNKSPALVLIISSLLRFGITLLGFYYISGHDWRRILACLIGFIMARIGVKRWVKISKQQIREDFRAS